MFGAGHDDDVTKYDCQSFHEFDVPELPHQDYFYDDGPTPGIMESTPEINIGLRPNSLLYSTCAKDKMAIFVSSLSATCLTKDTSKGSYCGNGETNKFFKLNLKLNPMKKNSGVFITLSHVVQV